MMDAGSSSSNEQENDSNQNFGLSSSDGFSSSSTHSSEDDSRTGRHKPATLNLKWAWKQSSQGSGNMAAITNEE